MCIFNKIEDTCGQLIRRSGNGDFFNWHGADSGNENDDHGKEWR